MLTVATLKFIIDLSLCGAVLYLAVRTARGGGSSPMQLESLRELESSLSHLLRQATEAGADLEQSLSKKQRELEEVLFDVETVEHRINKGIDEAREARNELKRSLSSQVTTERVSEPVTPPKPEQYMGVSERAAAPEPVSTPVRETIIEEPVVKESPLRESIEREVVVSPEPSPVQSLEEVYAQCEELIRAGKSVAEISRLTQMAPNEIEAFQGIINLEIEEEQEAPDIVDNDSRLGVLSPKGRTNPIGRTTQVL